jgi:hypothetical protein
MHLPSICPRGHQLLCDREFSPIYIYIFKPSCLTNPHQQCSSHDDVLTAIQFSSAYCGVEGVNTGPTGITTPLSQLPSPTGTAGGSSNGTVPAATTTPAATAAATTTHSGALGSVEPRIALSALLFAAIGVAAGL